MLWRDIDQLVITQPNHAWLAGQLARAWHGDAFLDPIHAEAVCLAAEQHDLGWHDWERAPTLNRTTGRPHFFREVPVPDHIALWRRGVDMAMALGRYPALLISLHASGLYGAFDPFRAGNFDTKAADAAAVATVRDFLTEQAGIQARLVERLGRDPVYRQAAWIETVARDRALIALTDRMSIAICSGVVAPVTVGAPGLRELELFPIGDDPRRLQVDPWPFQSNEVCVTAEGRALHDRFDDERDMRAVLAAADMVTIATKLVPASFPAGHVID